jgi:hypothetical protein
MAAGFKSPLFIAGISALIAPPAPPAYGFGSPLFFTGYAGNKAVYLGGSSVSSIAIGKGFLTYSERQSLRERIRNAVEYGLKTLITEGLGYFNVYEEVNTEIVTHAERGYFPSIDLFWGDETYTNTLQGGHSTGLYEKVADLFVDVWINDNENMALAKERVVADIEKFFGTNYTLPDSNGNATAFNAVIQRNTHFGARSEKPRGGVSFLVKVYYRIQLTNPNIGG